MKSLPGRRPHTTGHRLPCLLLLFLILCLVGCQSINHLREAQDSFNAAAALENKTKWALLPAPEMQGKLQQPPDQALADYNAIRQYADQLFPRDAAVLQALPGLIKIDLAYQKITTMHPGDQEQNRALLENFVQPRLVGLTETDTNNAVSILKQARRKAGKDHPVNVYLIQSQLAAFRNYQVAYQTTYGKSPGDDDFAKKEAEFNLGDLQSLCNELNAGPAGANLVKSWENYNLTPRTRSK